ncbi:tetratricopeptide repeat protein [Streptomyces sp. NPDC053069]|uniref:tetratricopeptide repeat protein n=1 Tax=Streptomyces sp. NPDC053069 TaxID=3365695 RepID=UPI0037D105F7
MARLSFEKKRVQQPVVHPAVVAVRVFGPGNASVGGASVVAAPGEEIQQAVLNHLQRLAISLGAPIRATIHDDRAGCVVPLEVSADGSSRVTGRAVRVAAQSGTSGSGGPRPADGVSPAAVPAQGAPGSADVASPAGVAVVEGARDVPRAAQPEPVPAGTVQAPTGQFGPAPVMPCREAPLPVADAPRPEPMTYVPAAYAPMAPAPSAPAAPVSTASAPAAPASAPAAPVSMDSTPATPASTVSAPAALASMASALTASVCDSAPTHTPARGFDAVAEEVLGDRPVTETAEGAELLTEPMTRINEAVRDGRIEAAAELADRTVAEASAVLGPRHAEVLHLRELSAYIAYLAGDPVRACRLSLDLARLRRQARDAEAAYGNVQSAATAWRAVRDPEEGLRLGRELIDLWAELGTEPGPAADDPRPLESARARMVRLTDRAARAAQG